MQLLGHENAFNFQLRQIETFEFFGKNFVASKKNNFLQKTLSLEVVERGGIPIIMATSKKDPYNLRIAGENAEMLT